MKSRAETALTTVGSAWRGARQGGRQMPGVASHRPNPKPGIEAEAKQSLSLLALNVLCLSSHISAHVTRPFECSRAPLAKDSPPPIGLVIRPSTDHGFRRQPGAR